MTLRHALSLKEERLFFYLRYCKYVVDLSPLRKRNKYQG